MITSFYAALCVLLLLALSVRTIKLRRKHLIALGGGERSELQKAIRAHGNFTEYVPMALLLIYLVEMMGAAAWWVHVMGFVLLLGRVLHAVGVSQAEEDLRLRISGMMMTLSVLAVCAVYLLIQSATQVF